MKLEQQSTKEPGVGASFAFWAIVFAALFLFLVIVPMTMVTLFISGVSAREASGQWIIAGGVVTYVISLGFIIRSLFRRK